MKRLLTSCFGLGYLPIAPGTWGALPVTVVFGLLCLLGVSVFTVTVTMVVIAVAASVVCVAFAPEAIKMTGRKDPSEVVADEVAGQAVVFIGIYAASLQEIFIVSIAGFLAFRFFDILKPWPCRKLEKLPEGCGILADDLMAGFYGLLLIRIILYMWFAGKVT